ncbi:unnamed protein product [Knipowitschia caucasica]|uniref:Max-binding protein MNT n=1 Tax=Knipowitschia caucasica TaxID=637954 RepID=A0AAV2J3D8_KNICA
MSIETLLEAAKFLELQALQQKAREDEFKEKLLQEPKTPGEVTSYSNRTKSQECRPTLIRPPKPPASVASVPIPVHPLPVVTPSHGALPMATHSPPPAAPLPSTKREFHQEQTLLAHQPTSALGSDHKPLLHDHQQHFFAQTANTSVQQQSPQVHRFPGSIVSPSQSQALPPQPGTLLQQAPIMNGSPNQSCPLDDSQHLDSKRRPGGAGTREVHNKLEKNRRAHLKECFETLRKNVPNVDEKKTSNLSVLRSALRYIQTLKRKEKEYEHDMERLAREKIATQQRLAELKNDLSQFMDVVEIDRALRQTVQPEEDQASTSTASEGEDIIDELDDEMELEQSPPPPAPSATKPELPKAVAPPEKPAVISSLCIVQQKASPTRPPPRPPIQPTPTVTSTHNSTGPTPALHPTVIAHSSVSHPSVIQTLNHLIQSPKHIPSLAPSTCGGPMHLTPAQQHIGHITVHPVAHLPTLYSQPVAITQSGIVGHITHTLTHAHPQLGGPAAGTGAALVGKQTTMGAQMVTHHTQLVGQTVLNPVTMVTMPSFPISTLKLA